jgi:hypothetical protein
MLIHCGDQTRTGVSTWNGRDFEILNKKLGIALVALIA